MTRTRKKIQGLQQQVDELKAKTSLSQQHLQGTAEGTPAAGKGQWAPACVEIKGFCEWGMRSSAGLSAQQVRDYLARLKEVPELKEFAPHMGPPSIMGLKSHKIVVPILGTCAKAMAAVMQDVGVGP